MFELRFIINTLDNASEDLEILFKYDNLPIDLECFNELNSILSSAENGVKTAITEFKSRQIKRSYSLPDPSGE